jgi:non-specific protein-tyrosine kinase
MTNDNSRHTNGINTGSHPVYTQSMKAELDPDIIRQNRCIAVHCDSRETDEYKVLRTQIHQQLQARGYKTVMVASPRSGEGKTLTSINLSLVFAREYSRTVMLVDCNLKKQDVHRYLGVESQLGLGDYLIHDRFLHELIVWPCIEKFTFISGGTELRDSAELLGSPRMQALVPELRDRYEDRYIIFDTPPLLEGADTLAFLPLAEAIVVVVQADRTSKNDIAKCLELIPQEKMLGFVLNRWNGNHVKPASPLYASFISLFRNSAQRIRLGKPRDGSTPPPP